MKICPNCNEWLEDGEDVCPHCGWRCAYGDRGQVIDNDDFEKEFCGNADDGDDSDNAESADEGKEDAAVKKQKATDKIRSAGAAVGANFKKILEKYNPWVIALAIIINVSLLLSAIDLFVSKYCWSYYPVALMTLGYCVARVIYTAKTDKKNVLGAVGKHLAALSALLLFYSLVVTVASKTGQDLSYLAYYVVPLAYIAYTAAVLILFFTKKITLSKMLGHVGSMLGICFIATFVGAVLLKAEGFALAMCILPFAIALLVFVNAGLYAYLSLKKKISSPDGKSGDKSEEVHIDYEIIDEDLTKEDGDDNQDKEKKH